MRTLRNPLAAKARQKGSSSEPSLLYAASLAGAHLDSGPMSPKPELVKHKQPRWPSSKPTNGTRSARSRSARHPASAARGSGWTARFPWRWPGPLAGLGSGASSTPANAAARRPSGTCRREKLTSAGMSSSWWGVPPIYAPYSDNASASGTNTTASALPSRIMAATRSGSCR